MYKNLMNQKTTYIIVVVGAASLILVISIGIRGSFGLYMTPITNSLQISREVFSIAIAIQMLVWGFGQPIFGAIADLYGTAKVIVLGAGLYACGLTIMGLSSGPVDLYTGAGALVGLGTSAMGFAIVLAPVVRVVPKNRRSLALGIATAGGSFGQFSMALLSGWLIETEGWSTALFIIAVITGLAVILAFALKGKNQQSEKIQESTNLTETLNQAVRHKSYLLLIAGFFVCGFHVTFVATHLPSYVSDLGLDEMLGAKAIALIGLANIAGTLIFGWLGGYYSKKLLLSGLYLFRSIVILCFVMSPKTELSVLLFAGLIGLLWLGTVPLTSGIVANIFGSKYLGTLFGIVFLSHQVGSFFGAWIGGKLFHFTSSYDFAWYISIALGVFAAIVHLPMNDKPYNFVIKSKFS